MRRTRGTTFDERSSGYGSFDESVLKDHRAPILRNRSMSEDYQAYSDSEHAGLTVTRAPDDFGTLYFGKGNKGTGRLRKKYASRAKGGIFQQEKMKRRVYARCIGSEIDTDKLQEYLNSLPIAESPLKSKWGSEMYTDTLHVYRIIDMATSPSQIENSSTLSAGMVGNRVPFLGDVDSISSPKASSISNVHELSSKFYEAAAKEIFVFEFGSVVFWGFSSGEELAMLEMIRRFVSRGVIAEDVSVENEDDMAFVPVPSIPSVAKALTISSDILSLPDESNTKQRLAMSFAIGQSTVLAVFEAQVETKIPKYKNFPQTLVQTGVISLPSTVVGQMIGELFVIRHDLNLYTDILDTPDFFWEEEKYTPEYELLWNYLEMSSRVDVLNKRLDMIKEMLDMLQLQMEHAEIANLDWIIIWLIVVYCFVEIGGIVF